MPSINGKNSALYQTLSQGLAKYNFREEELDLIYSCFVCVYAGAKYMPGQRLITVVYKLTSHLMREIKESK